MADEQKPWMIRDVPEQTRRKVKAYAAEQGLSMGEALTDIVERFFNSRASESDDIQKFEFTVPKASLDDEATAAIKDGVLQVLRQISDQMYRVAREKHGLVPGEDGSLRPVDKD